MSFESLLDTECTKLVGLCVASDTTSPDEYSIYTVLGTIALEASPKTREVLVSNFRTPVKLYGCHRRDKSFLRSNIFGKC